jgi:cell division transport system permease protein
MSPSTLFFHFEEALKNIRRNGLMSVAALSIVLVSMAGLGGGLYTLHRLHQFAEAQPEQLEMAAFLDQKASRERAEATRKEIASLPGVQSAALFPKEKAWEEYGNSVGSSGDKLREAMGEENPLGDRIDIRLSDARQTDHLATVLRNQKQFPDIHAVRDAREVVAKLIGFDRLVTNVGTAATILLILVTSLVIQNTIRLTVFARRREIRIMQLVGATPGFIRMPMILEGILYGVLGAAAAAGLVLLAANQISGYAGTFVSPLTQNLPPAIQPALFLGALVGFGALVGLLGSVMSLQRFLKRI